MRWRVSYTVWKVLTVPLQLQVKLKVHTLTLLLVPMEEVYKRAAYAKAVGSVVIMIDLVMGLYNHQCFMVS
jgi:ribulose 1,5-bisphosphate carboxylase large subunit-like protein